MCPTATSVINRNNNSNDIFRKLQNSLKKKKIRTKKLPRTSMADTFIENKISSPLA